MGRKKTNYTTEELKNNFKYFYIADDNVLYAAKVELPLKDTDDVYVFSGDYKYVNPKNTWFKSSDLKEL